MPASRQASGADLPCAINTSIWRSSVTICSALNLFFGMTKAPFQAHFLTTLGLKKPGQVSPLCAISRHSANNHTVHLALPSRGGVRRTKQIDPSFDRADLTGCGL